MEKSSKFAEEVLKNLSVFYNNNREWIMEYSEYGRKFNPEMVARDTLDTELPEMLDDCDIIILIANSVEQNILTCKLYFEINKSEKMTQKLHEIYLEDCNCVYQFATIYNVKIVHIHPNSTASFTADGSANAIRSALKLFRPKLIISLGVAFGTDPQNQQLGDVILSSEVIPYDVFNKDNNGKITLRQKDKFFTHNSLNAWDVLLRNPEFSLEEKEKNRENLIGREINFKWGLGAILSGGSVLSNERKSMALQKAAKNNGEERIIGGEMEGVGIYYECQQPNIPCIIIKGICDWGAKKNSWSEAIKLANEINIGQIYTYHNENPSNDQLKDCVQAFATDNATEALFRLLRFDLMFLKTNCSSSIRENFIFGWNDRVHMWFKQFFYKKEKLAIAVISFLIFIFFTAFNMFVIPGYDEKNSSTHLHIYFVEVAILVLSILIVLTINKMKIQPIKTRNQWVDLIVYKLDLKEKTVTIGLNDHRAIFNVIFSWWILSDKIQYAHYQTPKIERESAVSFDFVGVFNKYTVLQIEYEMANGDTYVHLLSPKHNHRIISKTLQNSERSIAYCERVFCKKGSKLCFMGKRNAIIHKYISSSSSLFLVN